MKYKLGIKYYFNNLGLIEEIVFHSVLIELDEKNISSRETYYNCSGLSIVTVDNTEIQKSSILIFKSKNLAIDYQIRMLKSLKSKNTNTSGRLITKYTIIQNHE